MKIVSLESILREFLDESLSKYGDAEEELIKEYAQDLRKYALQSFASLGGQARSRAKTKAAQLNGKKGGRPKKVNL